MAGAKDIKVDIVRSASQGDTHSEIHFVWR
jgi:hypothetical protein